MLGLTTKSRVFKPGASDTLPSEKEDNKIEESKMEETKGEESKDEMSEDEGEDGNIHILIL